MHRSATVLFKHLFFSRSCAVWAHSKEVLYRHYPAPCPIFGGTRSQSCRTGTAIAGPRDIVEWARVPLHSIDLRGGVKVGSCSLDKSPVRGTLSGTTDFVSSGLLCVQMVHIITHCVGPVACRGLQNLKGWCVGGCEDRQTSASGEHEVSAETSPPTKGCQTQVRRVHQFHVGNGSTSYLNGLC